MNWGDFERLDRKPDIVPSIFALIKRVNEQYF